MGSERRSAEIKIKMFFFPFVGGGHQIPMIDTARVFAAHGGVISTILTTPSNALHFQNAITRDQQHALPITIHTLTQQSDIITDTDMSAGPTVDTSLLRQPLRNFLLQHPPDAIVIDMFHGWATDVVDHLGIARIVFTGNGCFSRCVRENIRKHVDLDNLSSDYEPFLVPALPHRIQMMRSHLPVFFRDPSLFPGIIQRFKSMRQSEDNSFGTLINSFYDLEPAYADYLRNNLGKKAWLVGPVSLCNKSVADKTERGKPCTVDERNCLNWLNSKEPNSVLYVSFGSVVQLPPEQVREIGYGLEASGQSFIWVVGKIQKSSKTEEIGKKGEDFLPKGFEERMKESGKGLILRVWAPQVLILEQDAIGGFMTHCGWNSTLESVSVGVPMITWPLTAEQFSNEKLITEVLKIGVQVGSREWVLWNVEWKELVGRERVELAVKKLMVKSEETEEMRRRVKEIARNGRRAVEKGGTSYSDVDALIQELRIVQQEKTAC